ncbi:hypothetical protein [Novosphingopyxis iocasae]|uniref:hypothetical protein n=1 Tax=Novosphingopyxis iocasae TaxID=2762729 RepID=UPI001650DB85|nr:hypothetical protein [Novosphingopyxis iocasae]
MANPVPGRNDQSDNVSTLKQAKSSGIWAADLREPAMALIFLNGMWRLPSSYFSKMPRRHIWSVRDAGIYRLLDHVEYDPNVEEATFGRDDIGRPIVTIGPVQTVLALCTGFKGNDPKRSLERLFAYRDHTDEAARDAMALIGAMGLNRSGGRAPEPLPLR